MEWIVYAVILVVGLLVGTAMQKGPPPVEAKTIEDVDTPTGEGNSFGKLFGTRDVEFKIVNWYGDFRAVPIRKKGGKK